MAAVSSVERSTGETEPSIIGAEYTKRRERCQDRENICRGKRIGMDHVGCTM